MGRPARPIRDAGHHRAHERVFNFQAARRGRLTSPTEARDQADRQKLRHAMGHDRGVGFHKSFDLCQSEMTTVRLIVAKPYRPDGRRPVCFAMDANSRLRNELAAEIIAFFQAPQVANTVASQASGHHSRP
jgi:hypothetical protein